MPNIFFGNFIKENDMLPLIIGDNPFIDDFNDLLQMIPALKDCGDNIQQLRVPWGCNRLSC